MSNSITVTVRLGMPLQRIMGSRRVQLSLPAGATLKDLLDELVQRYEGFAASFAGEEIGYADPFILIVNARPVTAPHYDQHLLQDNDTVHILLPVAGGARDDAFVA
ncbi:MAG: hypothetical protein DSY55_05170 [Clostridia bacterium]|nr:MAG: hypothetical protein DSY55_05170 [Clostridia bacterium]